MLTWDNFEFVRNTENFYWVSLPRFPVVDTITERTLEQSLERADRMYLALMSAFVREAVVNNRYYAPAGSVDPDLRVWEVACKKNNLHIMDSMLGGEPANFRAAEDVVVKIVSEKPPKWPHEQDFESYKGRFWYRVNGDQVEYEFYGVISKETDQSKLGRV